MIKTILIVIALIIGFILINHTINPKPVQCPAGTTLESYFDDAMQQPDCKGNPIEVK